MGILDGVTNYHNQILDDKHVFFAEWNLDGHHKESLMMVG